MQLLLFVFASVALTVAVTVAVAVAVAVTAAVTAAVMPMFTLLTDTLRRRKLNPNLFVVFVLLLC